MDGRAAVEARRSITLRDNVGLHLVLGIVAGVAAGHDTLVKGALSAVTVITASAEDDGTLLAHGVVAAVGALTIVECREGTAVAVTTADGPVVGFTLDDSRHETVVYGRVALVMDMVITSEQTVLQVSHDPGSVAGAGTTARTVAGSKVDGLHVSVARISAVSLGIAVVEAAGGVVVSAVKDSVHALRVIVRRGTVRMIVPVAGEGRDENAVRLVAVQGNRGTDGAG